MGDIININSIHDYNEFLGIETLNPLVTFIDFKNVKVLKHKKKYYGFYGIYLKGKVHGQLTYGRSRYDYEEGTLVFVAPGQVAGIDDGGETLNPEGYALLFHPDLLRGTSLARKIKEYTFFSYEVNEALHMSERERQTIFNCFTEIEEELHHNIDRHSRSIITSNIDVLLNHCLRFYDRQFVTREAINRDVLIRFEELMAKYFDSDKPEQIGLPTVAWCADQLHFSANYFGDLIKKETGKTAIEYIHLAVINRVKDLLASTDKTVSEIAYEVGFQYPHHLSRLFKKVAGCTPNEYRGRA
ncbi:MAG: helix-turn-helix domain-containing protein [Bacteroidaceae bacterium]|jgi:AraC-like DNA-binding protein